MTIFTFLKYLTHPNLSIMRLDQHRHLEDGIFLKYKKGFNPKPQSVPPSKCSAWKLFGQLEDYAERQTKKCLVGR